MSEPAPTRQRRSHAKSRNGCIECKRQHRKCDEARPECSACTRLDATCLYLSVAKRRARGRGRTDEQVRQSPPTSAPHTPPVNVETPASHATSEFDSDALTTALDLELMAQALLNAAEYDISDQANAQNYTREKARLATTKPYLMHEMLAVSGLRLFSKSTSRRELMARALFHQSEALRLVQPHLGAVNEEHSLALLFFSSYAALCGLAEPALCDTHNDSFNPLEKMLHAFQLSRGIMAFVAPRWSEFRQTWAWPLINSQIEAGNDLTPQPQDVPGYAYLRCLVFGLESEAARQACMKALEFTLSSISLVQQRKNTSMSRRLVTSWPMETGAAFHALLTERRPVSLVILAYYAVLLKLGTGLWWIGNWPEVLLRHIDTLLGAEWEEFLQWPRAIILDSTAEPDESVASFNSAAPTT